MTIDKQIKILKYVAEEMAVILAVTNPTYEPAISELLSDLLEMEEK